VGWTGGVLSWLVAGAVVGVLFAASRVIVWANRWYIAERFYGSRSMEGRDAEVIRLLRTGDQQLVNGFFWLGIALLFVLVAAVVRRRRSR
jgi:LPXTG-motif cell wall-anchored protein